MSCKGLNAFDISHFSAICPSHNVGETYKVGYLVNETRDSSIVTLVSGLTLRTTKLMQRGEF